MSREQVLWQAVLLLALTDATSTSDSNQASANRRKATDWIRFGGRDFRHVCELAGLDAGVVRAAFMSGRIDPAALRTSQSPRNGGSEHEADAAT